MADSWHENAVIYQVAPDRFRDSNGDGHGDLPGVTEKLAYVAELGFTCVWLQPFYPSPGRDGGYDVSDHYGVDPAYGSPGDFLELLDEARRCGLKVILDFVMNHTSDHHPWFRSARDDPQSRFRDFYCWADEPGEREANAFPGEQEQPWTYDEHVGAWYYHRFYDFEPDLDNGNEHVLAEMERILRFWSRLGVDGFRVDAAPYVAQKAESTLADGHELFARLRRAANGAALFAEADVEPEDLPPFFGDGDRVQLVFNFLFSNYLFLALARERAEPIERLLRMLPDPPPGGGYATFLRNHDELDLERLTDDEREEVYAAFAPDDAMRIYGRGIRRRLAPMLGNDRARIELAFSLLFALPGTPIVYYGDELGMGEDLSLDGREAVRLAMQWSAAENGGFSDAPRERLQAAVRRDHELGFERVNAEEQLRREDSLVRALSRLVRRRRESRAVGSGRCEILDAPPEVLALRYSCDGETVATLHNLSSREVELDEGEPLGPYAYRWLDGGAAATTAR